MHRPHPRCPRCGAALPDASWPRTCGGCGRISYLNPAPVAVLLQPVDGGLLVIRRGIAPRRGQLALPGGFIDLGESWQQGCARELLEETGVKIDPAGITLFDVRSSDEGDMLLVFGLAPPLAAAALPRFVPHSECTERIVITAPEPLAFPLHTAAATRYLTAQS